MIFINDQEVSEEVCCPAYCLMECKDYDCKYWPGAEAKMVQAEHWIEK